MTSCKIRAYHTRVKANRESSWCGLSKKLFKDLEGCSRKNKSNARYERGKPGKPNAFQQTFFFPHFLQRLVTHLYLRKQNELVSISLFLFSFSGRSLTSLDSKVITLTLDIWMGRARAVGGSEYMRYEQGRPCIFSGRTPVADNKRLLALLHDAAVLQESLSCITISLPSFKGDEWLPWHHVSLNTLWKVTEAFCITIKHKLVCGGMVHFIWTFWGLHKKNNNNK